MTDEQSTVNCRVVAAAPITQAEVSPLSPAGARHLLFSLKLPQGDHSLSVRVAEEEVTSGSDSFRECVPY